MYFQNFYLVVQITAHRASSPMPIFLRNEFLANEPWTRPAICIWMGAYIHFLKTSCNGCRKNITYLGKTLVLQSGHFGAPWNESIDGNPGFIFGHMLWHSRHIHFDFVYITLSMWSSKSVAVIILYICTWLYAYILWGEVRPVLWCIEMSSEFEFLISHVEMCLRRRQHFNTAATNSLVEYLGDIYGWLA